MADDGSAQGDTWPLPKFHFSVDLGDIGTDLPFQKGVFAKNNKIWDWFNQRKMNLIKRQSVIIKLMDEDKTPTMTWTLTNAWPTKIVSTDLKSDGSEIAVESVELAHEGVKIDNK